MSPKYNNRLETVTIPQEEYEKLLEYKAICRDIYTKFSENGGRGL